MASCIVDFEYHEVAFAWWFDSRVMLRSICVAIFPAVKSFPCQSHQISWRVRALWCSSCNCIPSKSFSKSSKTFFFLTWLAHRPNDYTGNDFKGKAFEKWEMFARQPVNDLDCFSFVAWCREKVEKFVNDWKSNVCRSFASIVSPTIAKRSHHRRTNRNFVKTYFCWNLIF
jgi:hypothetical protein